MATNDEFLATFIKFKHAFDKTMNSIHKLKEDKNLQTNRAWEECLKMIDQTFEMPLKVPYNMEDVQSEWSDLCFMVERLTLVKEDILKCMQPKLKQPKFGSGLFIKSMFGTVIFAASALTLGYFMPSATGWFGRKMATTSMTVGKMAAPHGLQLLQKSMEYAKTMQKSKSQILQSTNELNIANLTAGVLGAAKAIKTGYDLMAALQQQQQTTNQSNKI